MGFVAILVGIMLLSDPHTATTGIVLIVIGLLL